MTTTTTTADANRYGLRAPKGGCTVNGRVFKGGQFCLPYDAANPHGIVEVVPVVAAKPAPIRVALTGFVYTVDRIEAGECGTAAFAFHKIDTNSTYHVLADNHGEVTCTCGDFIYRKAGTGLACKHGKALIDLGLIASPRRARCTAAPIAPTYRRRFDPSAEDFRLAAQMFADARA